MDLKSKIILISGPTASGKSSFSIKLAKKIKGEIINADSIQVYKQLKILSARPSLKNYQSIKHHLYGFQDAKKSFSTGDWLKIANNSPVANSIELNSIIIEAQKKKIRSADDLREITKEVLNSNQKTVLLAIYNNQNQRRYIGVKLD